MKFSSYFLCLLLLALLDHNTKSASALRILVTGAAGFVGSHVARQLLERGDQVVVVDEVNDYYDVRIKEANLRDLRESFSDRVSIHRGDIADGEFLDTVFQLSSGFDAICHMAARAGVRPSIANPAIYVHSNVKATVELLERAVKFNVTNFVFASSSSVYGGSKSKYFSETESVDRPISPYAATKRSCELFGRIYQRRYGLSVTALRFFTVYGPRGRPDMAPFKFIDRISRQKPIQQFGDGSSSRDYTFIGDIVNGVIRALDKPTKSFRLLNLGRGSGTSLKKFLKTIEMNVGKSAKIELLPDQPGDVPYTCANVSLARSLLGYSAVVPIEDGIRQTVAWYQQDYENQTSIFSAAELTSTAPKPPASVQTTNIGPRGSRDTILLTGGGSDLGSALARSFVQQQKNVVLLESFAELSSPIVNRNLKLLADEHGDSGRLSIHRGDLRNGAFLRTVFEEEAPSSVFHMGGNPDKESWSAPLHAINTTVDSTLHLLELSKGSQFSEFDVDNFILASSTHVSALEERQGRPVVGLESIDNPYSVAKKTEELLAFTYHHLFNIPVAVVRLGDTCAQQIQSNHRVDVFLQALEVRDGYKMFSVSSCSAGGDSMPCIEAASSENISSEVFYDDSWLLSPFLSTGFLLRLTALSQWSAVIIILALSRFVRCFKKRPETLPVQ